MYFLTSIGLGLGLQCGCNGRFRVGVRVRYNVWSRVKIWNLVRVRNGPRRERITTVWCRSILYWREVLISVHAYIGVCVITTLCLICPALLNFNSYQGALSKKDNIYLASQIAMSLFFFFTREGLVLRWPQAYPWYARQKKIREGLHSLWFQEDQVLS